MKNLTALNTPFKYVVTCLIMQKNGAGLHTAASCYWDNSTDGEAVHARVRCVCPFFVGRRALADQRADSRCPVALSTSRRQQDCEVGEQAPLLHRNRVRFGDLSPPTGREERRAWGKPLPSRGRNAGYGCECFARELYYMLTMESSRAFPKCRA